MYITQDSQKLPNQQIATTQLIDSRNNYANTIKTKVNPSQGKQRKKTLHCAHTLYSNPNGKIDINDGSFCVQILMKERLCLERCLPLIVTESKITRQPCNVANIANNAHVRKLVEKPQIHVFSPNIRLYFLIREEEYARKRLEAIQFLLWNGNKKTRCCTGNYCAPKKLNCGGQKTVLRIT